MSDRRDAKRIRRSLETWFRAGRQVFRRTHTFDLSSNGLAMYGPSSLPLDQTVDLTVRLEAGRYLTLRARTCWRRPCEDSDRCLFGLRFESDCVPERSALQRWMGCQLLARFAEQLARYTFRIPAWA